MRGISAPVIKETISCSYVSSECFSKLSAVNTKQNILTLYILIVAEFWDYMDLEGAAR